MLCNLQPHNFIHGHQVRRVSCDIVACTILVNHDTIASTTRMWYVTRSPQFVVAVAHTLVAITPAVIPQAISTITALHVEVVIPATFQMVAMLNAFILLVGTTVIFKGYCCGMVRRTYPLGIAGIVKVTGCVAIVLEFERVTVGCLHYFFEQRFIFLCIPLHFS